MCCEATRTARTMSDCPKQGMGAHPRQGEAGGRALGRLESLVRLVAAAGGNGLVIIGRLLGHADTK